jgi:hypothetical protein
MPDVEPVSTTFLYGQVQVKREMSTVLTSRIYRNGVQQSAPEAACPGSEWAIPMFRATIPHFTSKIVEHSRYLLPTRARSRNRHTHAHDLLQGQPL